MRVRLGIASCFVAVFVSAQLVFADDEAKQDSALFDDQSTGQNLRRLFVLETDEQSAQESLNRISGTYDRGFSSPEQSYQSERSSKRSPFDQDKSPSSY